MPAAPHDFAAKMAVLIQEHYVSREDYEKLKSDFDLLQQEHLRSKQIFQKKLEEWEALKQSLQAKSPLSPENIPETGKKDARKEPLLVDHVEKENLHMPKAPRLGNKASKRIILGGDTPPGYWSTRFTPET